MNFKGEDLRELRSILTCDEPLGPSNAEQLVNVPFAADLLFERQNSIYGELVTRSGIIVGRRGAGKTAFLNQLMANNLRRYVVFINAPDVFPEILRSIRNIFGEYPPLVEVVERLWEALIWSCIFASLLSEKSVEDARLQVLRDFALRIGFSGVTKPEEVIQAVIQCLLKTVKKNKQGIETPLQLQAALKFGDVSFAAAHEMAVQLLRARRSSELAPVLVLMDTLENYRLEIAESSHAVSGLLRYLAHQSSNRGVVDIRFCLPAELHGEFQDASQNPMKDFSSQTILHWHAGDLLRVVAHRLALYLRLYDPLAFEELATRFDFNKREGAIGLFSALLPSEVQNRLGKSEPPIAYILRHTQLLPRHAIEIFNRMIRAAVKPDTGKLGDVAQARVSQSIQECEELICSGVAQAYGHKYPNLWGVCRLAIPELPRRFKDGDLRRVFNRHVKGKALAAGQDLPFDYLAFKRMLIEVGAIGKQIHETELYHEAEFEYTVPSKLVVASDDYLCLHPLFSGVFPKTSAHSSDDTKAVYPYGSDPAKSR